MDKVYRVHINKRPAWAKSVYTATAVLALISGFCFYVIGLPVDHDFRWAQTYLPTIYPWLHSFFIAAIVLILIAFSVDSFRSNTPSELKLGKERFVLTAANREVSYFSLQRVAFAKVNLSLKPYRIEFKLKDGEIVRLSMKSEELFIEIMEQLHGLLPNNVETFGSFMDSTEK